MRLKSLQKKTLKSKLFTSAKKKYGLTCRDRRDQVEKIGPQGVLVWDFIDKVFARGF